MDTKQQVVIITHCILFFQMEHTQVEPSQHQQILDILDLTQKVISFNFESNESNPIYLGFVGVVMV